MPLPISVDPAKAAHKGLAAIRSRYNRNITSVEALRAEMVSTQNQNARADLRERVAQLLDKNKSYIKQIQEREDELYRGWAPEKPPTPERMEEIKKSR